MYVTCHQCTRCRYQMYPRPCERCGSRRYTLITTWPKGGQGVYEAWLMEEVDRFRPDLKAKREALLPMKRERGRFAAEKRRVRKLNGNPLLTQEEWKGIVAHHGGRCFYCGCHPQPVVMEHKTPLCRGGKHEAGNVVPACAECNGRKGRKAAEEFMGIT